MQRMSRAEYDDLSRGAAVLSADEHGAKVLLRGDGSVVKLFRRKRLLSSALLRPYARRFARASVELARRGIAAAVVDRCARVPSIRRDLVVYRRLEGTPLRAALAQGGADHQRLLLALARFLARLHGRGVYFRAAHFGNILVCHTDAGDIGLALIDISETQFRSGPLSPALRARNFRPLTRYPEDLAAMCALNARRFVQAYLAEAGLDQLQRSKFLAALRGVHPAFAEA
jgi:hypothetical protein